MQSTGEISNEPNEPHEESSSTPNEGLMMERTVPSRLIHNIAATRIQNAFRSFMVQYLCDARLFLLHFYYNFHSIMRLMHFAIFNHAIMQSLILTVRLRLKSS